MSAALAQRKLTGAAILLLLAAVTWGVVQCRQWEDRTLGALA